jgi:hypothetical protein
MVYLWHTLAVFSFLATKHSILAALGVHVIAASGENTRLAAQPLHNFLNGVQ